MVPIAFPSKRVLWNVPANVTNGPYTANNLVIKSTFPPEIGANGSPYPLRDSRLVGSDDGRHRSRFRRNTGHPFVSISGVVFLRILYGGVRFPQKGVVGVQRRFHRRFLRFACPLYIRGRLTGISTRQQSQQSVYVIRHDDERIEYCTLVQLGNLLPVPCRHAPGGCESHDTTAYRSDVRNPSVSAYRDEIPR